MLLFVMAQGKEQVKAKVKRVQQGLGVEADGLYGPATRSALMEQFKIPMVQAIKHAENNPRNHGVLSVKTNNPAKVVDESVAANLNRFMVGEQSSPTYDNSGTPRFVDFMQQRWAPVGVANDPNGLNRNWAPNVRNYLKTRYPAQYPLWQQMNLVKAPANAVTIA